VHGCHDRQLRRYHLSLRRAGPTVVDHPPGGSSVTMPTIVVTLKATGSAGTVLQCHRHRTSCLTSGVERPVTYDGYPTTGSSGTPPHVAATPLSFTTITGSPRPSASPHPPRGWPARRPPCRPPAGARQPRGLHGALLQRSLLVSGSDGSTLSFTGVGSCVVDANQAAGGDGGPTGPSDHRSPPHRLPPSPRSARPRGRRAGEPRSPSPGPTSLRPRRSPSVGTPPP
jgi:hypothetical protein